MDVKASELKVTKVSRSLSSESFIRLVPRQARSQARLAAIVDATGAVLERGGMEQLSMAAVAAEAGISPASIYDYFSDTTTMLGYFVSSQLEVHAELLGPFLDRQVEFDQVADVVHTCVRSFVDRLRVVPGLGRAMAAMSTDPRLVAVYVANSRRLGEMFHSFLVPHFPPDRYPDLPERCLLGVHLAGPLARLAIAIDDAEADRLIRTYLTVFLAPAIDPSAART